MTQSEFNEEITELLAQLTAKVKSLQDQVNELQSKTFSINQTIYRTP